MIGTFWPLLVGWVNSDDFVLDVYKWKYSSFGYAFRQIPYVEWENVICDTSDFGKNNIEIIIWVDLKQFRYVQYTPWLN